MKLKINCLLQLVVRACNFDTPESQYVKTLLLQGKAMDKIFDTHLLHKMALQYRVFTDYRIC
jgi:hypothetical protein